jgi:aminoglycoside 6'-N-acetyltransferase
MSVNPKIDRIERRPAPGTVNLRPATPADVPLLRHWDEQPHVIASDPNDDWQWESELGVARAWREQYIAEVDGRPIGYLEIIDPAREDSRYWGPISDGYRAIDLWIGEKEDLGRGYGTQIMNFAIKRSFEDPSVNTILVDPLETNHRAHRFYESLGFEYVVCRTFGDDCCFVYRLRRPGTATRDS